LKSLAWMTRVSKINRSALSPAVAVLCGSSEIGSSQLAKTSSPPDCGCSAAAAGAFCSAVGAGPAGFGASAGLAGSAGFGASAGLAGAVVGWAGGAG